MSFSGQGSLRGGTVGRVQCTGGCREQCARKVAVDRLRGDGPLTGLVVLECYAAEKFSTYRVTEVV